MQLVLTPELLLGAYTQGLFPMAHGTNSPYVHFVCPEMRGQLSISDIHISKSLKKTIKKQPFDIRIDTAFEEVIKACAEVTPNRPESWINQQIVEAYTKLHKMGHAHSVECWKDEELIGGLYGLTLGGAFFGESMFSRTRDASKVALIHLCARLWKGGFQLLDTQFINDHLKQFGVYEIPHETYIFELQNALSVKADFILDEQNQLQIIQDYLVFRS